MEQSITDACNTGRNKLVSVIMNGGDPAATADAKAELDKLQSFKTLFETLLKG